MAITKNENFYRTATGSTETVNVASSFTAGRHAIVTVSYYQTAGEPTLTCTIGGDTGVDVGVGGPGTDRRICKMFYRRSLTGGSTAVALGGCVTGDNINIGVIEFDDNLVASPVHQTDDERTPADPLSLSTPATTVANCLVVAVATGYEVQSPTGIATPSGYTSIALGDTFGAGVASHSYRYVTTTGVQSASYDLSAGTASGIIVAFELNLASSLPLLSFGLRQRLNN